MDLDPGDRAQARVITDDTVLDLSGLIGRNANLEEEEPVGIFNLAASIDFSRVDKPTIGATYDRTRVFGGDNFVLGDSEQQEVFSALGAIPASWFANGVDFLEFGSADDAGIVTTGTDLNGDFGIIAASDGGWFERAKAKGPRLNLLDDPTVRFILFADVDKRDTEGRKIFDVETFSGDGLVTVGGVTRLDGRSESAPLLPGTEVTTAGGFTSTIPEEIIPSGETIFIDRDIAVGYIYTVEGADFACVTAPTFGAVPDPDGFTLVTGGQTFDIASGEQLVFADLNLFDVTTFALQGIDVGLRLDPEDTLAFVTGVSFANATGDVSVTQTPDTVFVDDATVIPLPAAAWMLLGGLGLMAGIGRRRA